MNNFLDDMVMMRDILGFEGRYMATKDGRIWSVARRKYRVASVQRNGYLTITVRCTKTNKTITKSVHRLIATAWISNPNKLPQINHKDGDKQNCAVDNLEWCTGSDNMKHAWKTGLQPLTDKMIESTKRCGAASAISRRRLSLEDIEDAKKRILAGELQKHIAAEFGVSRSLLSQAINGKTYKDIL